MNVNRADKFELLRVPGLGLVTVNRILNPAEGKLHRIEDIGKPGKLLNKARAYLTF